MKINYSFILVLTISIFNFTSAQYFTTNDFQAITGVLDDTTRNFKNSSNAIIPTAVCNNPNTFWVLDGQTQEVKEFEISGSTINFTGNSIPNCPGFSLAISNNLNGGAISPTIYTSDFSNNTFYWNGGTNWVQINSSSVAFPNAGGYNSDLYFQFTSGLPSKIAKYGGINYTHIFNINKYAGVADIAADGSGNIWLITKSALTTITDSVYQISPTGQVLQRYPLALNSINAYGSFFLNNVLYIGFGGNNPIYPNSIIPVTFTGTTANASAPFFLPGGVLSSSYDLASCYPGLSSPLPVELITFKAVAEKEKVKLLWTTASESDCDYFLVQRSTNGTDFVSIDKVNSAGSTTFLTNYYTYDNKPNNGINYYRLKQTDLNGDFVYSKTVSVKTKISDSYSFNYNTATNQLGISCNDCKQEKTTVLLTDATGRNIYTATFSDSNFIVSTGAFAKGAYTLQLQSANAFEVFKFVIY